MASSNGTARVPALAGGRLTGRRVRLRALEPSDYQFLYELATGEAVGLRWRHRGTTPSPDEFVRSLWDNVFAQYLVVGVGDGEPIGHVVCYSAHPRDQIAYLGAVSDPARQRSGLMAEAIVLFISYLFDIGGFRKLYAETPEYNLSQFGSAVGRYFTEEGRLRSHEWYLDRYWDVVFLAAYRDGWRERSARVLHWIEKGPS